MIKVDNQLSDKGLLAGIVTATNITISESTPEFFEELDGLIAERADLPVDETLRTGVRDMLRGGGFKPSGRNKPASEYLVNAAKKQQFPRINNVVDINNYISLKSGLPASLLDMDVVGEDITIRYGLEGESYVFNSSGQEINISGLISVCRQNANASLPLGNPVKDSMEAKTKETTKAVLGIVYAPKQIYQGEKMEQLLQQFGEMLVSYAQAEEVSCGMF